MTTSLRAITWPVFRRHRWGLTAVLATTAAAMATCLAAQLFLRPNGAMLASGIACTTLMTCAMYLAGVFSYGFDSDLATAGTCFPARQFTLPVRTLELAGWPMLTGTTALALLWTIVALVVFRESEVEVPVGWPILLLASQLTWMQALLWWPFGLPWTRPITAILLAHLPATGVILAHQLAAPSWAAPAYLTGTLAIGVAAAMAAVARSRRGMVPQWEWVARASRAVSRRRGRRVFTSARHAQNWYEFRRHGYMLPLLTFVTLPIFGLLALFIDEHTPPKLMWSLVLALSVPVFFAGMSGIVGGKNNPWAKDSYGLPSFTATRPVTTAELVASLWRAAVRTTLSAWAVALIMIAGAFVLSGAYETLGTMIQSWLDAKPASEVAAAVAVAVMVLPLLTWKRLVESLLVGLTGREWLIKGVMICILTATAGAILFALWFLIRPDYHHYVPTLLPWVLAALVAGKFALAAAAIRALRRKRLVADQTLLKWAAAWLVVDLTLFALLAAIVPGDKVPISTLAMGVVLLMPLARVSAMPLALDWNRHR